MTNEELMKQLEDSLRRLIDNSSAVGKLEARNAGWGLSETDIIMRDAFRANALRHKEAVRVIIKDLIEKVEDHGKGAGLHALCKKCGNSWQVPNK